MHILSYSLVYRLTGIAQLVIMMTHVSRSLDDIGQLSSLLNITEKLSNEQLLHSRYTEHGKSTFDSTANSSGIGELSSDSGNNHPAVHHECEGKIVTKVKPIFPTLQPEDVRSEKDKIYLEKYYFLPARSKMCDNVQAPGLDYTLVTVLLDLRREDWPSFRRQFLKYCYYAVQMLNLHAPMIIYVDEQAVDFVEYHRQGKEHFTEIIPVSIRDLEYYKYYDRIVEVMSSEEFKREHFMLNHPEGFSADYNILMNSKFSMLFHASTRNYFSTNYFYWMDVGYGHGEDIFPTSCLWSPNAIMNDVDQITYIELNPLDSLNSVQDVYKQYLPPFLNGAFFGGPTISIKRYYFLHREVFESFLSEGKVDDDQTMAVACYFQNPLLFNIVKGWWYDAFTLFK